jgi:hypothetical protein
MLEAIRNLINGVNDISNVIELPTRLITILGIMTTALGYFTGRRRSLFEQSARGADEAMREEMRQGFAAVSAALAALAAGQAIPQEQSITAVAPPRASVPAPAVPPAPHPLPAAPPVASGFAPGLASPARASRGTRRWARRPALAIGAAVALALTLMGVIGIFIASVDDAVFGVFSLLALLGLVMALVTLIWACVAALRQRRWGWATALFFGTLALTFLSVFTLPTLLILIFAVWGPAPPLALPVRPQAAAAPSGFVSPAAAPAPTHPPATTVTSAKAAPFNLAYRPATTPTPARPAHAPAADPPVNPTANAARAVRLRSAPPTGRLMPPTFPAPAQPLYPAADMAPSEEAHGS